MEEEEDLIRVQLEEVHESPAVKEQIARVLREAYREKFGTDPEPGSSSKRPSRSHKDPVDELDDLPSSELDELEEKYGQSIEVTSEGQARLKGSERQEKERLEKAKPATEMVGKVSREEYERQRAATKEIERERRKEYEKKKREQLEREKKEAKAIKEINPKKEELRTSAPVKVRPNPPEDVPHWINASDGSLKSFREVHRLSQWQQDGKGDIYVSCLRCQRTIRGLEPYSLWAHIESKGCYPDGVLVGWRKQRKELEKRAEQEKAYQATQAEALRKAQKSKEVPPSTLPPPTLGPSIPFPMRVAQIAKPRKGEVVETITTFQVRDVPKVKANPIRLKSRSRTSGGMDRAVRRAADEALQSMSTRKSDRNKGPSPEEDPLGIEPMSLIPREIRERREDRDRERSRSPSPEVGTRDEGTREVRMNDDRGRSEEGSEDRRDDRRKRFRYEETSSDSELNFLSQGENSKAALNVVWATVDSGAATSCLPVELCQERRLEVESTSDLPYTNASGAPVRVHRICHPKVTIGNQDGSKVAGTGTLPNHCYQWRGL